MVVENRERRREQFRLLGPSGGGDPPAAADGVPEERRERDEGVIGRNPTEAPFVASSRSAHGRSAEPKTLAGADADGRGLKLGANGPGLRHLDHVIATTALHGMGSSVRVSPEAQASASSRSIKSVRGIAVVVPESGNGSRPG